MITQQKFNELQNLGIETTNVTLKTKNYTIFKTHEVNREIVEKKVNSLAKLMKEFGWLEGSYVIVDKDFVIINGQHRFEAARIIGIEIHFIQLPIKATAPLIRRNNLDQMSWTLKNTIDGFAAEGHKEYKKVGELQQMFPFLKSTDILMIAKLNTGSFKKSDVENGLLKVTDIDKSIEWGYRIKRLQLHIPDCNTRYFTRALAKLFVHPEFDFERLMKKIEQYPADIKNWKQTERNFVMLSDLYNKDLQRKKHTNFELV